MSLSFETAANEAVLQSDTSDLVGNAEPQADATFEQADTVNEAPTVEVDGVVRTISPYALLMEASRRLVDAQRAHSTPDYTADYFTNGNHLTGQMPWTD